MLNSEKLIVCEEMLDKAMLLDTTLFLESQKVY